MYVEENIDGEKENVEKFMLNSLYVVVVGNFMKKIIFFLLKISIILNVFESFRTNLFNVNMFLVFSNPD